jgi:hypothetical protein
MRCIRDRRFVMKRMMTVFCAALCLAQVVPAQSYRASQEKSLSIIGSFASGFGIGGYYQGSSYKIANTVVVERKDQYLNYGEGIKLEAGAHYRLTQNLGCQGVLGYTWGLPTIKISDGIETETYKRSMFGIKALVTPQVQVLDLIDIYAGFGFGLFFGWMSWEKPSTVFKGEYKTNPAFAFCGSIGAEYPVINELILYGELAIEQMNFNVTRSRTTASSAETVYEQNSTASNLSPPPKIPGSNVALRIGVRFPIL